MSNYEPANGVDAPVFDWNGNRLEGMNFLAMLYVGLTTNSLQGLPTAAPFLTGIYAGYFYDLERTAPNIPVGSLSWVQVRAWDARLGQSYEDTVQSGLGGYGESNPFQVVAGGAGVPPTLPAFLVGLQSFSLRPEIPEPSAVGLLLLGTALLFLRNRFLR